MCEPATLAIIGTAVAVTGSAVNGVMAMRQANYERALAQENQRRENAKIADAIDRSEIDQQTLARKYGALRGQQRAAMAANGIDVDFGSAADVIDDTNTLYREDASNLDRNLGGELRGIDISAANYGSQAKAAGMKATGAAISTAFDIGSTVLGGLGKVGKINAAKAAGGSGY